MTIVVAMLLLLPLPGFTLIACALISLLLLRRGVGKAFLPFIVGCVVTLTIQNVIAQQGENWLLTYHGYDVFILVIAFIGAYVLRSTSNWAYSLFVCSFLVLALSMVDSFVLGFWQKGAEAFANIYLQANVISSDYKDILIASAHQTLLAIFMGTIIVSLILGRYWQSRMFMPKAFGAEFRAIRIPISLAVLLFAALVGFYMYDDLRYNAGVVGAPLLVAGVAMVHYCAIAFKLHKAYLVIFYLSLVFNVTLLGVIALALVDSIVGLRRKIAIPQ